MPFNAQTEWKPNRKQERFIAIPFSVREALYGGGAGSGKTELLLMLPIIWEFYKNPRFKQVLLRRTTKQLKKEVVPRSQDLYPRFGAVFNEGDLVWTFPREDQYGSGARPSGARIYLSHCENENDVHNYDSMEINLFTPDEITSLTEYIYIYIGLTRVRSSDPALPAIIRAAGMPGDVGHSFTKRRFIDPYPKGGKIIVGKGGLKRIFIQATLADNPNIDPSYKQSLEGLPEAEKQAKLHGSWDAYLGQVFEEFRDKNYPDEPANAVHIIKAFNIPTWWPKIVAIDWGFNAMCSVGWAAISPNKRVYIYRHQHWVGKKIEEWAPEVKFWIDKENPADIIICHSANQHRGDPHSIQEQVSEALTVGVRLGERNRIAGKVLIHEYLRWKQRPNVTELKIEFNNEHAQWILRNRGLEEYHNYLTLFREAEIEKDIPRLQFFDDPDVKIICDAIKACSYAKETKDGKKQEDVAEFDGDDPYDMTRMLVHAADQFFNVAADKATELDRRSEIIQRLEETGDMTGFYRNMKRLESSEHNIDEPIMMFHGSRHYGHRRH